jgi:uridine kinase
VTEGEALVVEPRHLLFARTLLAAIGAATPLDPAARTVIGIAGESGSGKSITATALAQVLGEAGHASVVLHQDDYFVRPPRANHEHRCVDLSSVGPQEVDLARLARHVADFHAARNAVGPWVDHRTDTFRARPLPLAAAVVLIVEGTYVLGLDDLDVRVFLEATHRDTAERRRRRNRDVDAPIVDQVLAIEHGLIAPQSRLAHIVVDRDFAIRRVKRLSPDA